MLVGPPRTGWRHTKLALMDGTGKAAFDARASARRSFGWLPLVLAAIALPIIIGLVWFIAMNRVDDDNGESETESVTQSSYPSCQPPVRLTLPQVYTCMNSWTI
jgi:hypothetical protein